MEHPSDRLYNTTVEVLPLLPLRTLSKDIRTKLKATNDSYLVIGKDKISKYHTLVTCNCLCLVDVLCPQKLKVKGT